MLPQKAYGVALLGLEGMGPARLNKLGVFGNFEDIWRCIQTKSSQEIKQIAGVGETTSAHWKSEARKVNVEELYLAHSDLEIVCRGEAGYPVKLDEDPEPPVLLFAKGQHLMADICSSGPIVAIVGTRKCSRYGADIAFELGRELALKGVVVLSGLAMGIDYAAHWGSVEAKLNNAEAAPSAAIVGCGLDIVYPKRNQKLYGLLQQNGVIISEAPLKSPPKKWRFPARNRIIAGLADLIIVVESHLKGGALITAEEAGLRGKSVLAVPGSIRSPASTGTNHLIAEGCQPLTDVSDVFMALGLNSTPSSDVSKLGETRTSTPSPTLDPTEQALLDAFSWEIVSHDNLIKRTDLDPLKLSHSLEILIQKGLVARKGLNFERIVASPKILATQNPL